MGKRITAPDTLDTVQHLIAQLQSEGWGLASLHHDVEYVSIPDRRRQLPVAARVVIEFTPAHADVLDLHAGS